MHVTPPAAPLSAPFTQNQNQLAGRWETHVSYLLQPAKMLVEIDIIHPAGPSLCSALPTLGNNLATATKTPKNPQQDKNSPLTCAFYPSCSHTSTASILQPAEQTRTSVHVVCCLGSLKLLEPSRISPAVPVGCSPFLSSLEYFSTPF